MTVYISHPKEQKAGAQRDIGTPMLITLFTRTKRGQQPKCPLMDDIHAKYGVYARWNTVKPEIGMKFWHMLQHGYILRTLP